MSRSDRRRAFWRGFFGFFYPPLLPDGCPHIFTRRYWINHFCWRCWRSERQAGATVRVAWRVARGHR